MKFDEIAARIYDETDFARSLATAVAGVVGLSIYLWKHDAVIAAFAAVIVFPVVRLGSHTLRSSWVARSTKRAQEARNRELLAKLSDQEKDVLRFFVAAGGACVSWGFVNSSKMSFPRPALNSLMARGLVHTSVMEDGMTESFVLDTEVFDIAQRHLDLF